MISFINIAREEGRTFLTEVEAKQLLQQAGINVVESRLAKSREEVVSLSRKVGFPVVLKVISSEIIHKSDAGGVKLGLQDEAQVAEAYNEIVSSVKKKEPQAYIQGISVQKMAKPGVEVIIGMSKDQQFGPILMFGLGGIFVEILKDVSFRIVPITTRDAREMIREIKGFPILQGYRGQPPVDLSALEECLLCLSKFVGQNPIIKEIDLNPVFAYSDSALAVDARIVLEPL